MSLQPVEAREQVFIGMNLQPIGTREKVFGMSLQPIGAREQVFGTVLHPEFVGRETVRPRASHIGTESTLHDSPPRRAGREVRPRATMSISVRGRSDT